MLEVFAGEALATSDLEDFGGERILAAEAFDHFCADLRREARIHELKLTARGDAIEIAAERFLREDLERPLVELSGLLVFRFFRLVLEDLTEVCNRLPERQLRHGGLGHRL